MAARANANRAPDVRIIDCASVLLFQLLTDEARAWVEGRVCEDRQFLGNGLAVEPRYAAALAEGMTRDGLIIEPNGGPRYDNTAAGDTATVDNDRVIAVLTTPRQSSTSDRYDLGWLFTCWLWESGIGDWTHGVRVLARILRGLERTGLVERRTIRQRGQPTHHGFVLTDEGYKAVAAMSGDWIEESHR